MDMIAYNLYTHFAYSSMCILCIIYDLTVLFGVPFVMYLELYQCCCLIFDFLYHCLLSPET